MNIAASPDPALLSAPDEIPGILTALPRGFTEIPFADLLGMPPESSPEGAPGPCLPTSSLRKQAVDTTDPALITLLPFLAQQVSQTPPAPPLPSPPEGEKFGIAAESSATILQTGSATPAPMQSRGIFLPRPQRVDDSATAGLPTTIAAENPALTQNRGILPPQPQRPDDSTDTGLLPSLAADEPRSIPQTDVSNAFATHAEHPISSIESAAFPGDSVRAGAIERQPTPQLPQSIGEPIPVPIASRGLTSVFQPGSDAATVSAPEIGATPAIVTGTNPPAEFAPPAVPPVTSEPMPMNATPDEKHGDQMRPKRNSDAKSGTEANGTTTAMQLRAMPEQFTERTLKAKPNGPVTASAAVQNRTVATPEISARAGAERRIEPEPTTEKKSLVRADAVTEKGSALPATVHAPDETNAPISTDATAAVRITRQTMDLAEHVRAMGRDHVEVQMRLRDGEEVTVSLRLEKGEWKPVFKTDSEALCRALEQNWNRAVAQPSAQAVRFGTPVFESQNTQTGSGQSGHPNGQQQPDARDRSFNRREQEPAFTVPAQPARPAVTTAAPTRTAASPTVQLYA